MEGKSEENSVPTRHAWYSANQAYVSGSVFYQTLDGVEVEVTEVGDPWEVRHNKRYDDSRYVGVVRKYIRPGQPPTSQIFIGL